MLLAFGPGMALMGIVFPPDWVLPIAVGFGLTWVVIGVLWRANRSN
jgi:hypothetical protein